MTEPAPRHTVDTITSDALDELYDERDALLAELQARQQTEVARAAQHPIRQYPDELRARAETDDLAIHRFTAAPLDPEMERAATERSRQAAEDSERAAAWIASFSGDVPKPCLGRTESGARCILQQRHDGDHEPARPDGQQIAGAILNLQDGQTG